MDKRLERFLRRNQDTSVSVIAEECFIYIPDYYFTTGSASWTGNGCKTLGIIKLGFVDKTGKEKHFSLDIPVSISIPMFREKEVLEKDFKDEKIEYTKLLLYKGDTLFESSRHIQSLDSIIDFLNFFNSGKIPKTTAYSEIPDILKEAISINGMSQGVPDSLIQIMVAELCRLEKDDSYPFRIKAGTKNGLESGYKFIGVKEMAEKTSVFSAISFEYIDRAVRSSVTKTRDGTEQYESPIEEIMYY